MSEEADIDPAEEHFISELHIDDESLPVNSVEMQHERRVAIFDLLEDNVFKPADSARGPYVVRISLADGKRLIIDVARTNGGDRGSFKLSLVPFRRVIKDYFMICESYHNAIRTAGLRNNIEIDFNTSRRLFTLICALHRRN